MFLTTLVLSDCQQPSPTTYDGTHLYLYLFCFLLSLLLDEAFHVVDLPMGIGSVNELYIKHAIICNAVSFV